MVGRRRRAGIGPRWSCAVLGPVAMPAQSHVRLRWPFVNEEWPVILLHHCQSSQLTFQCFQSKQSSRKKTPACCRVEIQLRNFPVSYVLPGLMYFIERNLRSSSLEYPESVTLERHSLMLVPSPCCLLFAIRLAVLLSFCSQNHTPVSSESERGLRGSFWRRNSRQPLLLPLSWC